MGLANEKLDADVHVGLKSRMGDDETVLTYWHAADAVNSTGPGESRPCETGVSLDELDFRIGNPRPARVRHGSIQIGPVNLRHAVDCPQEAQRESQENIVKGIESVLFHRRLLVSTPDKILKDHG